MHYFYAFDIMIKLMIAIWIGWWRQFTTRALFWNVSALCVSVYANSGLNLLLSTISTLPLHFQVWHWKQVSHRSPHPHIISGASTSSATPMQEWSNTHTFEADPNTPLLRSTLKAMPSTRCCKRATTICCRAARWARTSSSSTPGRDRGSSRRLAKSRARERVCRIVCESLCE